MIELTGYPPFYGLRSIRLRHECGLHRGGLVFAEFVIPGEIHLYSVPTPPWRPPSLLSAKDLEAFARHGARIAVDAALRRTLVEWAGDGRRDFYSQDRPLFYPRRTLSAVQRSRPDLLLIGGADHRELGSAIRSATAFGWDTALLQDRHDAWYTADRAVRSESRGMARRGRNPIRVVPFREKMAAAYRKIIIMTRHLRGRSLFSTPLTGGDTLLVLPDERENNGDWHPPAGMHGEIVYASLPAVPSDCYHFRQTASLALAEAARQLGRPDSDGIYLRSRRDRYHKDAVADIDWLSMDPTLVLG